LPQHLQ